MISRRQTFLGIAASGAISTPAFALIPTPRQATGPFYPEALPSESDANLVTIGTGPPATGEVIEVKGQVLGLDGRPIPGANVQLWQANAWGRYSHSLDRRNAPLDPNFQGFGAVRTDETGRYRFLTIKPGEYPGRTRHLHFLISGPGFEPIPTQMYFAGDPGNARDGLLNSIRDQEAQNGVVVEFTPSPAQYDALSGRFDIVVRR